MFDNAFLDEKNKIGYAISINEFVVWNKGRIFIADPSLWKVILNISDLSNFEDVLVLHLDKLRKYRIEELYE